MVSIMKALPADRPLHRRYLHVATTSDPVGWGAREVASNVPDGLGGVQLRQGPPGFHFIRVDGRQGKPA